MSEVVLAKKSKGLMAQVGVFTREKLEAHFPFPATAVKQSQLGRANVSAATRRLREKVPSGGFTFGQDRKTLQTTAYGGVRNMTRKRFNRLLTLLGALDEDGIDDQIEALVGAPQRKEMFRKIREGHDTDWTDLPDPMELAQLLRGPNDPVVGTWAETIPAVGENQSIARAIERFLVWGRARGHPEYILYNGWLGRILGPLLDWRRTEGLMRPWGELKTSERVAFIEAGITRAKLMLGDVPITKRAERMDPYVNPPPRELEELKMTADIIKLHAEDRARYEAEQTEGGEVVRWADE